MKKYILRILLLIMMFNLCSCNSLQSEQNAVLDTVVDIQSQDQASQDQADQEQVSQDQETAEKQVLEYEVSELLKMTSSDSAMSTRSEFPSDYEEFSNYLKKVNCSVIAGRAFGTRTANPRILTQFSVEKVYAGPDVPDQITVSESFGVYTNKENNEPYIVRFGYDDEPLANDQPTLLFVVPHSTEKDLYATVLLTIPLPEDHQNYDVDYLTELLNYFRGNRTAYKYLELTVTEITVDGSPFYIEKGGHYWPTREISDETLLGEMNDHILLRLITDYKIKIWPVGHREYPLDEGYSSYFMKMCFPVSE